MLLLFTCLAIFSSSQAVSSVWENLTATIAIVEYRPVGTNGTTRENVLENTLEYLVETQNAYMKNKKLDMIIFPEATLGDDKNTSCEVVLGSNCTECEQPLKSFASLARFFQTYVVVNIVEKSNCGNSTSQNCKDFGSHFYNTDVVFDRNGTIINRYRKYNLWWAEYDLDKPATPEKIIIPTNFGVKFGIFTCFDILFKSPAQDLVSSVDGILFPTMWYSDYPFLTAIQAQQMWAHEHNITFFAACANDPAAASGGSGVYKGSEGKILGSYIAKGGTGNFIYSSENGDVSLSQSAENENLPKEMDGFYLKRDTSIDNYQTSVLNGSVDNYQLCYNGTTNSICCTFSINMSTTPRNGNNYTYHLVAYSGSRSFDGFYNAGIEVCGIIACLNSSKSSCGQRFPDYEKVVWPNTFRNITIIANFTISENRTQFPNSLLSSILPINAKETVWTKRNVTGNMTERTFSTVNQTELLTFAIYGRNFALDSPANSSTSSPTSSTSSPTSSTSSSSILKITYSYLLLSFSVLFSLCGKTYSV